MADIQKQEASLAVDYQFQKLLALWGAETQKEMSVLKQIAKELATAEAEQNKALRLLADFAHHPDEEFRAGAIRTARMVAFDMGVTPALRRAGELRQEFQAEKALPTFDEASIYAAESAAGREAFRAAYSSSEKAGPNGAAANAEEAEERIKGSFVRISDSAKYHIQGLGAGAFNAYADAMDNAITTGKLSSEAFGRALQNVLATTLRGIGQESAMKGAFQIAEGIAGLASGDPRAGGHFVAAGKYFAVAAAAGAAAGAVSVSPGGGGGRGGRGGRDGGREVVQNVTVIGALDSGARADLARQLREEIDQGDG